jgi:16S rRNA (guanine1207-N2)-methyltransferase
VLLPVGTPSGPVVSQPDPHYKKTVTLEHGGRRLALRVAQELFSSHEVDVGTRLLLRTLGGPEHQGHRLVLDLGCGYGPLGLGLAAVGAGRTVHLVDRDALAVEYTLKNAAANGLDGVQAYGSLGYADVRASGFDLIVSNIPAKAGPPVVEHLLLDAAGVLAQGGLVAVVVIASLRAGVAAVLEGRPDVEVVFGRATASYAVFHYRFTGDPDCGQRRAPHPPVRYAPPPGAPPAGTQAPTRTGGEPAPPAGTQAPTGAGRRPDPAAQLRVYERRRESLTFGGIRLELWTAWGLAEFDSLGFASELVGEALLRSGGPPPGTAVVVNPGQGVIPALLWATLHPGEVRLVDRDLLALRVSQSNLVANGCPPDRVAVRHRADLEPGEARGTDLAVAVLRPKEPPVSAAATAGQLLAELRPGGRLVLGASSTAVTRCLAALEAGRLRFATVERRRRRGFSAVVLERPAAG